MKPEQTHKYFGIANKYILIGVIALMFAGLAIGSQSSVTADFFNGDGTNLTGLKEPYTYFLRNDSGTYNVYNGENKRVLISGTDATTVIQQILNNATYNSRIVIYNSTYPITNVTKTWSSAYTLEIVGVGNPTIISNPSPCTLDIANIPQIECSGIGFNGVGVGSVIIEGITLQNKTQSVSSTSFTGLFLKNMDKAMIKESVFSGHQAYGIVANGSSDVRLDNVNASYNGYGGFGYMGSYNVRVEGGNFSNNGITGTVDGYGIAGHTINSGTPDISSQNVVVHGVTANFNKRKGIDVHNGREVVIDSNYVLGSCNQMGIYAVGEDNNKYVQNIKITNNYVNCTAALGTFVYGIEVGTTTANAPDLGLILVQGNTIEHTDTGTSSGAIFVENPGGSGKVAKSITISNNQVRNGTGTTFGFFVETDNNAVKTRVLNVNGNYFHSASLNYYGVLARVCQRGHIENNIIEVDSGTVTAAYYGGCDNTTVVGNSNFGLATYTNDIVNASLKMSAGHNMNASQIIKVIDTADP